MMAALSFRSFPRGFSATKALLLVATFVFLLFVTDRSPKRAPPFQHSDVSFRKLVGAELTDKLYDYNTCIYARTFKASSEEFWKQLTPAMEECQKALKLNDASLEAFRNDDEIKYHILPNDGTEEGGCIIVTAGIGHDIKAELGMRKRLRNIQWRCDFHGADPIVLKNKELFSSIGTFYNFAVGNKTATEWTSVKEDAQSYAYTEKSFPHVEMLEFLKKHVNVPPMIDQYFLDIEYAEYGIAHYFLDGSPLDSEGIEICQVNIEFHGGAPNFRDMFMKFMRRALRENRWIFLKPVIDGHARLYMLNIRSLGCAERYIVDKF